MHKLLKNLSDGKRWNWCDCSNNRSTVDAVLSTMADCGIIEEREHQSGGLVWRYNGRLYGRTDGVTLKSFERLKRDPQHRWQDEKDKG